MSASPALHDEPGTRTRLAWARTALVALVVTALVLRGLTLRGAEIGELLAAALPGLAFVVVAVARARRITPGQSPAVSRHVVVASAALSTGLAVVAALALIP